MRSVLALIGQMGVVRREERVFAGYVNGAVCGLGGLTLGAASLLFPSLGRGHLGVLLAIAAAGTVWGLVHWFVLDLSRLPGAVFVLTTAIAVVLVAVAVACSGGARSPAWVYLFFVAVYVAYFYKRPTAIGLLVACVLVQSLPLLYDARATQTDFLAQLVIAGPAYLMLGAAIISAKQLSTTLRLRAESLAAEQAALSRVARAVVDGDPDEQIYAVAAEQVAVLLDAVQTAILRLDGPESATVTGSWSRPPLAPYAPGVRLAPAVLADAAGVPLPALRDAAQVLKSGEPVLMRAQIPGQAGAPDACAWHSRLTTPIKVGGELWGVLGAVAVGATQFTERDEQRLMKFVELLATAIASIVDRAKLAAQALTDPLTGLSNSRAVGEWLTAEVGRAVRHGTPLSIAVIDVDHFKQINDNGGHDAGDAMLLAVASALRNAARAEDTLGRLGGDEFVWLLPETTSDQALMAIERARRLIHRMTRERGGVTVSVGISDTTSAQEPAELIRLADRALYRSKARGRNQASVHDPEDRDEASDQDRAERIERSQALAGLAALGRAVDARDQRPGHGERVSAFAQRLALSAGWPPQRALMLRDAALVRDVGRIAAAGEHDEVEAQLRLAARILEGVLDPEQLEWIEKRYARPDGRGHPQTLREHGIPEGAALLALAGAWDELTTEGQTVEEAMAEVQRQAGKRFTNAAVAALMRLAASDGLLDNAELDRAADGVA